MKPSLTRLLVPLLLAFIFVNGVLSVQDKSFTYDEPDHLRYGQQVLSGNASRFDDSKMPISALNALPQKLSGLISSGAFAAWLAGPLAGRAVTLLASVLLGGLVYRWAKRLYGVHSGLLALFLYAFDPNLAAHAQLITTDLYAALTITFALYALWMFCRRRTALNALLCALALALAQVAKYTGVYLFLLFPLILALHDFSPLRRLARGAFQRHLPERRAHSFRLLRLYLARSAGYALLVVFVSFLVINSAFLWQRSFTPLKDYHFRSGLFQSAQRRLSALGALPLPLPYPYLEGLDWVFYKERTGAGYGRIYLLGQLKEGAGFPGYFWVASLFKVPLAAQLLTLVAFALYLKKFSWRAFRRDELFLLAPVLFFSLYFNFFFKAQIGIRFILVIFPCLHIFAARLVRSGLGTLRSKALLAGSAAWLVVSMLSYYPQYLAYFNELVPDRRLAYRILADSNLDWGQNQPLLRAYLASHPTARFDPVQPVSGIVVVSANALVGILTPPRQFAWLRENYTPVGTLGYSYLIFAVPP